MKSCPTRWQIEKFCFSFLKKSPGLHLIADAAKASRREHRRMAAAANQARRSPASDEPAKAEKGAESELPLLFWRGFLRRAHVVQR